MPDSWENVLLADLRRAAEERRQRELERLEQERLASIESARVDRLASEIASWWLGVQVREYVTALEATLEEFDPATQARVISWCERVQSWTERDDVFANLTLTANAGVESEDLDESMS